MREIGSSANQCAIMSRVEEFVAYHKASVESGDCDPSYPMLRYLCKRFELNNEQKLWLAFLYACSYCGATAFYVYNEFPDYRYVDIGRMERWWGERGRSACLFQSDRAWVRSRNQFVEMVRSYRGFSGEDQAGRFASMMSGDLREAYRKVYVECGNVFQMGRFGLFLWLEALNVVAEMPIHPPDIDWKNAQSSRNGLCYAIGRDDWLRGNDYGENPLPDEAWSVLPLEFDALMARTSLEGVRSDPWNLETTLCAFKKFKRGKRYVGYYLDRQWDEIQKLASSVREGVCWDVLRQFRNETFSSEWLVECGGCARRYWSAEFARCRRNHLEPKFI